MTKGEGTHDHFTIIIFFMNLFFSPFHTMIWHRSQSNGFGHSSESYRCRVCVTPLSSLCNTAVRTYLGVILLHDVDNGVFGERGENVEEAQHHEDIHGRGIGYLRKNFMARDIERNKNKAVYTAIPVAGSWAGAVMSWAGAEMIWAGA